MFLEISLPATARVLLYFGAFFFSASPYAEATVISYDFLPMTEVTMINDSNNIPYTETFTGSFSYDDMSGALSAIDVTMSGPYTSSPVTFLYSTDALASPSPFQFGLAVEGPNAASGILVELSFSLALGGASDPLEGADAYNSPTVGFNIFWPGSPVSSGGIIEATPLPAALPLFATGLSALGLLGWRRKRKSAAAFAAA
jgi:hypothetical protein